MSVTVLISARGQITLPLGIRKKYSLEKDTPLIIDETGEGLLLRKASMVPIRQYTDEEIQSFLKEDPIREKDKKWLK